MAACRPARCEHAVSQGELSMPFMLIEQVVLAIAHVKASVRALEALA